MRTDKLIRLFQFLFIFLIPVSFLAQDFKTVHDGVEYAQVTRKLGEDPVKINLLRLDLTKVRLDVHHAMDAAIGTERTSSIAARHGAVAAINAGFFRLDKSQFVGDASNILMIDGKLLSESGRGRVVLTITNDSNPSVSIERTALGLVATLLDDTLFYLPSSGVNRERGRDDLIFYSHEFGATTLTDDSGVEMIVNTKPRPQIKLGSKGNNAIPKDGFVFSASGSRQQLLLEVARLGVDGVVTYHLDRAAIVPLMVSNNVDMIAGVPQLIKNGRIDITWEQEKASRSFVETRHPRTAVAKLKDGRFLMITVDGRQPGVSVGMNLYELADYLLSLGAIDAMNLDGGGSTTMVLDGKVVNKPSDKDGERKVGDAILVTLRNKKSPAKNPKK